MEESPLHPFLGAATGITTEIKDAANVINYSSNRRSKREAHSSGEKERIERWQVLETVLMCSLDAVVLFGVLVSGLYVESRVLDAIELASLGHTYGHVHMLQKGI